MTKTSGGAERFFKVDFAEALLERRDFRPRRLIFSGNLGVAAAEAIASSQIEELLSRGVINGSPTKGVTEWFRVEPSVAPPICVKRNAP